MPTTLLEKMHHTFTKKGIPNKLEETALIAKVNGHPIVIEKDQLSPVYRIMVLTDIDLTSLEPPLLMKLLNANFEAIGIKTAADPEDYLVLISEVEEECIPNNSIEFFLEKVNNLINHTQHLISLFTKNAGSER